MRRLILKIKYNNKKSNNLLHKMCLFIILIIFIFVIISCLLPMNLFISNSQLKLIEYIINDKLLLSVFIILLTVPTLICCFICFLTKETFVKKSFLVNKKLHKNKKLSDEEFSQICSILKQARRREIEQIKKTKQLIKNKDDKKK